MIAFSIILSFNLGNDLYKWLIFVPYYTFAFASGSLLSYRFLLLFHLEKTIYHLFIIDELLYLFFFLIFSGFCHTLK